MSASPPFHPGARRDDEPRRASAASVAGTGPNVADVSIDARPPTLNLTLYAGDDLAVALAFTDDDGVPVDVSGDLVAQVRRAPGEDIVVEPAIDDAGAAQGEVTVVFSAEQTRACGDDGGTHRWDLQRTDGQAVVGTLVRGTVSTVGDITDEAVIVP